MSQQRKPIVIVGAGQAGGWVALTLNRIAPEQPVVLIGSETHPPYERPPLSKDILLGKSPPESAYLKPLEFFEEVGIDLRLGTEVERLDPLTRTVELSTGDRIEYESLVLATGSRPRILEIEGADAPCVRTLRSLSDLEPIRRHLKPERNIVCIGAGFIGLEVAAATRSAGCNVHVVEAAPHALGRAVAPQVADALVARHERHGVDFTFDASVKSLKTEGAGATVTLSNGQALPADLVIVGVGGTANDQLARRAGLDCSNGVCVDENGCTSDPHIFAVGDVAHHFSRSLNRSVRLESWQNAQNQAIALAHEIAGRPEPCLDLPWFWTDQYGDNFQIIGMPERWDRLVWRGSPDADQFTVLYMDGPRVCAGNTLNNARDIRPLRAMITEGAEWTDVTLADTSRSLTKIQKTRQVSA
ncbi:NAD(P)/FAD-dependent oxidoreductase [Pelagibacterium sp.]|uniref:NAD(P)/FAD-dependent oxidoreductase n=1 Tax=Pelagibacterium sp. TaxID=1967288 RepID=UPI003BA85F83